jgi:hypothetical protein
MRKSRPASAPPRAPCFTQVLPLCLAGTGWRPLALCTVLGCLDLSRPDCTQAGCSVEGYACNSQTRLCEPPSTPAVVVGLEPAATPVQSDAGGADASTDARSADASTDAADAGAGVELDVCSAELSDACVCRPTEQRACGPSYPAGAHCRAGTQACQAAMDGRSTSWSECEGAVGPLPRNCADSADNDCDGRADNTQDSVCQCVPGAQRTCGGAACRGSQPCIISEDGTRSSWGDCALPRFGEPQAVLGLGFAEQDIWGPALSSDGRTLLVASGDPEDLFLATRPDRGQTFGALSPLTELNTPEAEGTPFASGDGLTLYFYALRAGVTGDRDLWVASRATPTDSFGTAAALAGVNSAETDQNPWLSPDGLTLVFDSTRSAGFGQANLWMATRSSSSDTFGTPSEVPGVNSDAVDEGATLSADQLEIFFDSNRPGGAGNLDIWRAQRDRIGEPFGAPLPLDSVNSFGDELDLALTLDGTELFFSSERAGVYQIYRSSRSCQ